MMIDRYSAAPPRSGESRGFWIVGAISVASSASLIVKYFDHWNDGGLIVLLACTVLNTFTLALLLGFLVVVARRKLHRYARIMGHLHAISHTVRDSLATARTRLTDARLSPEESAKLLRASVTDILNCCATSFSIVTGHSCAVCLKEIDADGKVKTVARDIYSNVSRHRRDVEQNKQAHHYEDSSSTKHIIGTESHPGFFYLQNNLPRLYRQGRYENPAIAKKITQAPRRKLLFGLTGWALPYRSTLGVPVRFLPPGAENQPKSQSPVGNYWGFLYIDSPSKNCFDVRFAPDLALSIADSLFSLFAQMKLMTQLEISNPQP